MAKEEVPLLSRRGKFKIAIPVMLEAPETVLKVMSGILVLGAACHFTDHTFLYEGASEHFEPVEDGDEAPMYDMEWDDETETATWKPM